MNLRNCVVALAAFVVAGCAPSRSNFEVGAEAARGSPAYRAQVMRDCVRNVSSRPLAQRRNVARLINTSVASLPQTFCRRAVQGVISGRLTYDDLRRISPRAVRVLQGR